MLSFLPSDTCWLYILRFSVLANVVLAVRRDFLMVSGVASSGSWARAVPVWPYLPGWMMKMPVFWVVLLMDFANWVSCFCAMS